MNAPAPGPSAPPPAPSNPSPDGPVATAPTTHGASRAQLEWLRQESSQWQAEGLVSAEQAERLLARYSPSRGFSLGRLLLGLGACFFGVGLIWLVASNLEELSPGVRFGVVAVLWLAFLLGAEVLHARRVSPVVVGAARTLAAFAVGAVVFQAAQSLQVPAYEARLVGVWGVAALLHAYLTRARGPLLVGLAGTAAWSVWHGVGDDPTFADFVWTFALTGALMVAVAALHRGDRRDFAAPWRSVGAALALVGLFVACLPFDEGIDLSFGWWHGLLLALALVASLVAVLRGDRLDAAEVAVSLGSAATGMLMVAWVAASNSARVDVGDVAHACVGVLLYVGLAVGLAVSGTLRDSRTLTTLSTVGLVVFTTFQSFAVFGEIITGAWLFLVLGLVFLATGFGFDRARRRIADELAPDLTTPDGSTR